MRPCICILSDPFCICDRVFVFVFVFVFVLVFVFVFVFDDGSHCSWSRASISPALVTLGQKKYKICESVRSRIFLVLEKMLNKKCSGSWASKSPEIPVENMACINSVNLCDQEFPWL